VAGLDPNAISSLGGIGIKLDATNHLTIDTATLEDKLNNDLDAVRNVLEFRFNASSPDLSVLNHGGSLGVSSFTLHIATNSDGTLKSATAPGVQFDVSGGTIKGPAGSPYAGLEMVWTGHADTDITVSATQGVADKLYNYIGGVADDVQGSLTKTSDDLGQRDTDYQTEIDRINRQADSYRQQLVDKYAAMETALSLADSMLQQVKATVAGWTQSN
jgi:flagellar hook-associated protein 2